MDKSSDNETVVQFSNPSDATARIGTELITVGDVVKHLIDVAPLARRLYGVRIRRVRWEDVSGDGYTSSLYRLELELDKDDEAPISVVFKSFSYLRLKHFMEEMFGTQVDLLPPEYIIGMVRKFSIVHNAECRFYNIFGGVNGHPVGSKLPLLDIYAHEPVTFDENQIPCGYLLMEDLTKSACTINMAEGLNEVQVRRIIDVMTDFHVALLSDLRNESASWLEVSEATLMSEMTPDEENHMEKFIKQLEAGCDKSAIIPYVNRIRQLLKVDFYTFVNDKLPKQLGLPILVCHGDMWANNILWKRRPDGGAGDELAALIDWQLSHRGNIMSDFARLLVTSCDKKLRESVEAWLAPYYHKKLSSAAQSNNIAINFTIEQLQRAYDFSKAHQSIFNLMTIEPLHRAFLLRSPDDPALVESQTQKLIDRAVAVLDCVVRFLAENAPEWLSD